MNTSKIIKGVVGGVDSTSTAPIIKEDYGFNKERRQTDNSFVAVTDF